MHTFKINKGKATITLGDKANGEYPIVSNTLVNEERTELLIDIKKCAEGVEDLDAGASDFSQCFDLSTQVKVDDCIITPTSIKAKNLDMVEYCLGKVAFAAADPWEICV